MLQSRMGGQHGIIWLNDGGGDLRSRIDGKFQLGLLSVVDREALHQQGSEAGSGAAAERVEDEETLEAAAIVRNAADAIQNRVDDLLSDGVVPAGVVVGRVFFAGDQLLRMEELLVCPGADLVFK